MTRMRIDSDRKVLERMDYLVGDSSIVMQMPDVPSKEPFAEEILDFLNETAGLLRKDPRSRAYSDVATLAFWLRKASTLKMRDRFVPDDGNLCLGRGTAFHIAPSNVPVNFAFSLFAGLLTGNANIVRVPSRDFEQVAVIRDAIQKALEEREEFRPYIVLVRYGRDKEINDILSGMADTRVVWGGDATIAELRKSPLPPRSTEITFADRYSLAVIDADAYLSMADKDGTARSFYNDTYFSDQNACTSPRIVVWLGKEKESAKKIFWEKLHRYAEQNYAFQPIQGINKLASSYLAAILEPGAEIIRHEDNLLVRVRVPALTGHLMDLKDSCGYFFEYDCEDILELKPLCDDKRCQTVSLLGDRSVLLPLLKSGIRGIDRVVPMGKTMDFDLLWDGYDLTSLLTRTISLRQ